MPLRSNWNLSRLPRDIRDTVSRCGVVQKGEVHKETRLYYYNRGCEIDFCVPEAKLAIQVSCEISKAENYTLTNLEPFLGGFDESV